ncbi:MAG: hypothetical protein LN563_04795 [Rickettsia endosymbiont of Platyusa sonomae]|nr:hypothetical protein [Rickettsia endosymbiont of Platyusa sonomae]
MTIDFKKYVKDTNFLDLPKTEIFIGSYLEETECDEINANIANNPDSYQINLAELVDFIKSNTNITRVNLPCCGRIDKNNISFVELIKISNITNLNIAANGLGDTAANDSTTIIESIAEALKNNITLTSLDLSSNDIGVEKEILIVIAEALKNNRTLTNLNLSSNYIGVEEESVIAIVEVLKNNRTLTNLDLSNNILRDNGTKAIAGALVCNSTLASLNLSSNYITNRAVKLIAKMLDSNKTLTNFDLSHNRIAVKGIKAIAEALKNNKTLTHLDLSYNCIDAEGIKAIAEALKNNKTLTHLDLSGNRIDAEGIKAIAEMLESNTNLTNLNLGTNVSIDATVIENINKNLQRNKEINDSRKDISESFKAIISKITLDTDGTPLVFLDKEDSEQNSFLKTLQEYSEKYGRLFLPALELPALEQSIAQSLYQNTVHIYKNGTEQLSFAVISDALTKVTQTILERLGFKEDKINEFNSKIVEIIEEVKEMFWLELDILNNNLMDTSEINIDTSVNNVPTNTFAPDHVLQILLSNEFTRGEWQHNQQLTDLYEKHPELKIPGTILHNLLKSDSPIYPNIAVLLNQHVDEKTFKHNPLIQEWLNKFSTPVLTKNLSSALENNNIEDVALWLSAINLMSAVQLESDLLTKLSKINNKAVEILLVNQPLKLLTDNEGNNLLHLSLQNGNYQLATRILKEGRINTEQKNSKSKTTLDILHESPLAPEQKANLETLLAQYPDTHLSNANEHTQIDSATAPITPDLMGDSLYTD